MKTKEAIQPREKKSHKIQTKSARYEVDVDAANLLHNVDRNLNLRETDSKGHRPVATSDPDLDPSF